MHEVPHTHFTQDAYLEWLRKMTSNEQEACLKAEREAGERYGHVPMNVGLSLTSVFRCSCGWKGTGCQDDPYCAYAQWVGHLVASGVGIIYPKEAVSLTHAA